MDKQITLTDLRNFLVGEDVPIVGVTAPFYETAIEAQLKHHEKLGQYVFFGDVSLEQRQNIEAVFPLCKQIIVIGIPYNSKNMNKASGIELLGKISNMAWAYDYHHVVNEKLAIIADYIKSLDGVVSTVAQVDTGPLIDRHIAYRAGIGSYGKNQNLMHDQYGTEFYIGYLLIDKVMVVDDRDQVALSLQSSKCHSCHACVSKCPANVLADDFSFKGSKCISYLTQKKEELTYDEMMLIGKNVYGCDVCQLVCPQNIQKHKIADVYMRQTLNGVDLKSFIGLSNKALMRHYKSSGFAWRGAKVLKRNAIIALGHHQDKDNIPFLMNLLNEKNPFLIPAIIFALYQSGAEEIKNICGGFIENDEEFSTKNICQHILQLLK